jgi:hypothetical protein
VTLAKARAKEKAEFVVGLRMQPSEYDALTVYERAAIIKRAKKKR